MIELQTLPRHLTRFKRSCGENFGLCVARIDTLGINGHAVQSHVNWFLQYLDQTIDELSDCPWLALYACKAFLAAWQLVRKGLLGAMAVVGVLDGDTTVAI